MWFRRLCGAFSTGPLQEYGIRGRVPFHTAAGLLHTMPGYVRMDVCVVVENIISQIEIMSMPMRDVKGRVKAF
jgi:hypothetical protein